MVPSQSILYSLYLESANRCCNTWSTERTAQSQDDFSLNSVGRRTPNLPSPSALCPSPVATTQLVGLSTRTRAPFPFEFRAVHVSFDHFVIVFRLLREGLEPMLTFSRPHDCAFEPLEKQAELRSPAWMLIRGEYHRHVN